MDKPNKEILQAFIDWFMREYSNFGGKPISERYEEEFDTFNNDFIDARYDAFQDGWKAQQAKVEKAQTNAELLNEALQRSVAREEELQKRIDDSIFILSTIDNPDEAYKAIDFLLRALRGEQALKGE